MVRVPASRQRASRAAVAIALSVLVAAVACSPQTVPAEQIVLRVVMADDWAETDAVVETVRTFERAHPGTRVDVRGVPFARIPDSVRSAIDAGQPFDVAHWHPFAAAAQGLAEPLDDLWERDLEPDDFLPGALEDVTWGGSRYGVPLDTNAMILLLNRTALEAAGVEPAELASFDGFTSAAQRLSTGSRRAIAWPSSSWVAYGMIRAHGGELVEVGPDGEVTFTLDAPEAVAAFDLMGTMVAGGLAFPPNQRDDSGDAFTLFRTDATAMLATGTWDLAALDGAVPWDLEAVTVPRRGDAGAEPGTALGGSGLFVPSGAANRELAFAFMLELTDDATALRLAKEEGRLPATRRLFDDPFFDDPGMRVVRTALDTASPMRLIAFPVAQEAFSAALDDVLLGRALAAEALARAQRVAEASLAAGT